MKKIIKIKPYDDSYFRINYIMSKKCPYRCRYCSDTLHSGTNKVLDLENLQIFLQKFNDRKIIVNITGGEPTLHPQFLDLVNMFHDNNVKVNVDTNGIRTIRFFEECAHLIDNWSISLHPSQLETIDIDKIKMISASSFVVIYVLIDPDHFQKSLDWYEQLSAVENIRLNAFRIIGVTYTAEQEEILKNISGKWNFTPEREAELEPTHGWLRTAYSIAYYDDGTQSQLDFAEIWRNDINQFEGWICNTGNESITIIDDGTARWGVCGFKTYDNFMDIDPEELKKPVLCGFKHCNCGTDMKGTKHHPNYTD